MAQGYMPSLCHRFFFQRELTGILQSEYISRLIMRQAVIDIAIVYI
jgi:hypothetical protein